MKTNRRGFFGMLASGAAAAVVVKDLPAAPTPAPAFVPQLQTLPLPKVVTWPSVGKNCVVMLESTRHGMGNYFNNVPFPLNGGMYGGDPEAFQANRPLIFDWPKDGNNA